MTWAEPSLFDAPFDPAAEQAIAEVEANAAPEWMEEAEKLIRNLTAGTRFIGEQIVDMLNERGVETHDLRAMGPVMQRLGRAGIITKTGEYRAARSSHGSPKPVWEKGRDA
jgi:hypothetical protein